MTTSCETQGLCELNDLGVIRVQGEDATAFLHGQLTQDLAVVETGHASLAGYCSAKGRLLASFVALRQAPQEWWLVCSADLLAATLKRLSMFVLRSSVKLDDASAEKALWGRVGPVEASWPVWHAREHDGATALRLPDAGACARLLLIAAQPTPEPSLPLSAWHGLEAQTGVARICAATAECFVPQMVNLDLVGGVSFSKGCYPGQEVVARSQYRGTVKRRGHLVRSSQALHPGQEVSVAEQEGDPVGQVVLAGQVGQDHVAFVELKTAMARETLRAGEAILEPLALPYALPDDVALP